MPERAYPNDSMWGKKFGILSSRGLAYLDARYRFCKPYIRGKVVLDVACGTGMGFRHIKHSSLLVGLDIDHDAVILAGKHFGEIHNAGLVADMTRLPLRSSSFEVVTCLEGIEHVSREEGMLLLSEISRVLRSNGQVMISTPLSRNGMHSGNPHHEYEWSEEELFSAIAHWFHLDKKRRLTGPAGEVIILRARQGSRQHTSESTELRQLMTDSRLETVIPRVRQWISGQWSGHAARYASQQEASLMPTCFAVLAEETLGSLSQWTDQTRERVAAEILSQQDVETGLFGTKLVSSEDLASPLLCDLRYLRYQITYFALSALSALGKKPAYPLSFAHSFVNEDFAIGWVDAGPWHDPWNHSNRIMFLLRFLTHLIEIEGFEEGWDAYDAIIRDLLRRQSPETGLWHGVGDIEMRKAAYAAYHFFPFMLWRGIAPPHTNRIIDSTLSIQHADGLFGSYPGGGACEDLDAIDILVKFSLLSDHREADVRRSLLKAYDRIIQLQTDDGGFPNRLPHHWPKKTFKRVIGERISLDQMLNRPYKPLANMDYYSGWVKIGALEGSADMWSAWFRPLALCLIASRYPELGKLPSGSRFHKFPGLGWHNQTRILALRERAVGAEKQTEKS